jgi:FkbM family methyltransferase
LRRLTYNSGLLAMTRFLGLTNVLRKFYYRWGTSPGGILRANIRGIDVQFHAPTPAEVRRVEGDLVEEQDFLQVLISTLGPGDVFFDVGGSIGQFTIPVSKVVGEEGQVIAFEPEAQVYRRLQDHLQLNKLSNVRVFRQALGDQPAAGRLFVGGGACPSLLVHEGDSEQQLATEEVDIVQGDWLVRTEGLPIPRAVKIDVEGYEYAVLRGLQQTLAQPACKLLCCEIHPSFLPTEVDATVIVEFVKSLGFIYVDISPRRTQFHMIAHKEKVEYAIT